MCQYEPFGGVRQDKVDRRRIGGGGKHIHADAAQVVGKRVILRGVAGETLHSATLVRLQLL